MELTQQQKKVFEQIQSFLTSDASVFILRGYAGTGKTTMIKAVADYISRSGDVRLMAPTGRAARVLSQKTGYEATTIHRAIYSKACIASEESSDIADTKFRFVFPVCSYEGRIVAVVDESSMVCSRTVEHDLLEFGSGNVLEDLLDFVGTSRGGKVIFVGDPAQLPPVGESKSNALSADYFTEKGLKVLEGELTEVLRQDGDSVILKNAMMIRDLLAKEKRNHLVFEEKVGDVECISSDKLLDKYLEHLKSSEKHDSVIICYSNKSANGYNKEIRQSLYGVDVPIMKNDVLIIAQNNYLLGLMNGDFVQVMAVGARTQQSAPVYVQNGGVKTRTTVTINFVEVTVPDVNGNPMKCMLIENLLTSDNATLSIDESRALYINFCIRNQQLRQGTKAFADALTSDIYYNALRAKYGYSVTGHKCQGGEWRKVFVDYTGRTGLKDDCLRWAYTATTRARNTLYVTNLPHITPFSKFRIDPIQKCKNMDSECRIIGNVEPTPFHDLFSADYLKAKYHCIVGNMKGTPYEVLSVVSKPYLEIYQILTPDGPARFDIGYKAGGIFLPAKPSSHDRHTPAILMLLNNEHDMPYVFDYTPSDEIHEKLYNLIRSACDGLLIQVTNVVEHPEDYNVVYYMRTSGAFSYIMIYINKAGFVTYAKPMSMLGQDDDELKALIEDINNRLV